MKKLLAIHKEIQNFPIPKTGLRKTSLLKKKSQLIDYIQLEVNKLEPEQAKVFLERFYNGTISIEGEDYINLNDEDKRNFQNIYNKF